MTCGYGTMTRRRLLASTAVLAVTSLGSQAFGRTYPGGVLPWEPSDTEPPMPVRPGPWLYFTADEAAAVEAIVDRLIPAGRFRTGRQAGGVRGLYRPPARGLVRRLAPPLHAPAIRERNPVARAAIADRAEGRLPLFARRARRLLQDDICRQEFCGARRRAAGSGPGRAREGRDQAQGRRAARNSSRPSLQNTMEGFFADPIYGGNRDMAGWKLIGFPGARYDYRDHVGKHNQPYPLPPVSILGRSDWSVPRLKASSAHGHKTACEGRRHHRSRLDRRDPGQ